MARFDRGWCQLPRESLAFTRGDPILKALFSTLCMWANVEDSVAPNGTSTILVRAGQLKTTAMELSQEVGCDHKTIQRKLKLLSNYGLISVQSVYRGVLVILEGQKKDASVPDLTLSCPRTNPSATTEISKVEDGPVPDLGVKFPCIEEREKEREGEGESARAREEPPPLKLPSVRGEEPGAGNVISLAPPVSKKAPPIEAKEACDLWHVRSSKLSISKKFTLEEITAILTQITEETPLNWLDLLLIVKVLNSSTASIAQKFLTPAQWREDPFKDGLTYLDKAHALASSSPEGKALRKLEMEKAREALKKQETAKEWRPRSTKSLGDAFRRLEEERNG